jgi:hypothetical protein
MQLQASGFTPIINPSNRNLTPELNTTDSGLGYRIKRPPMTLQKNVMSPNWNWSYLNFYRNEVQQAQNQGLADYGWTDIISIIGNPELIKKLTPTDAGELIVAAKKLGIDIPSSALESLVAIKNQGAAGDSSANDPVTVVDSKKTLLTTTNVLIGAAVLGAGVYLYTKSSKKSRRK